MRTYLLIAVTLAVTAVWAVTEHPLLIVAIVVLTAVQLWECDRDNRDDDLAPYRYPGGDR